MAELKQLVCNTTTQRFLELAIAERDQRLMAIQDRWDRLREAIVARAAVDHKRMMATGIVCLKLKSVRGKSIALSKVMTIEELEALEAKMVAAMEAEKAGKVVEAAK